MAFIRTNTQEFTPTTGTTVTIGNANADIRAFINPAGTLANLTIAMPNAPFNGQECVICSSKILTSLTITVGGGVTILSVPVSLAVDSFAAWVWSASSNTWFRAR